MYAVEVDNISKSFEKVEALKNISFNVKSGSLFGFIGPDGSGKTTLFRILVTLLKQNTGTAKIQGLNNITDYKKIRNMVGYMPGKFSLYQDLSVEENLTFFATVFGTTVENNYYLIKDIYSQIEPFKTRLAGKLSGGMKQKLALSCAMIHKPEVLFLDEPTTGVDAVSRKEFWEMLKVLKNSGITILVSTPYMDEAELCDEVALIQDGKILKIETPQNIITAYEKNLFAVKSTNMFKLIADLRNFEFSESVFPFGQFIHYTDKRNQINENELKNYLIKKEHQNIVLQKITPNIEDCFMSYLNK
jgi:ABC-type multidrug transport system ATPase subunit